MNNRPDENTLISYLYGELGEKDSEQLSKYFEANPGELKHLQKMAEVLDILGALKDKEVIPPRILTEGAVQPSGDGRQLQAPGLFTTSAFRWVSGVAASFLLLLTAGWLMGTEISASRGELRISFAGGAQKEEAAGTLTAAEVQQMIKVSMQQNGEDINRRFVENQKHLEGTLKQHLALSSRRIDDLVAQTSRASHSEMKAFVAGMKEENLQLMKDYLLLSTADQKKYMENLLVDFSKFLHEQRNQDLMLFQTRMSSIEQNSSIFREETEQILASIISNSNEGRNGNNY